ncbi:MAG: hypothetical protein AABX13_01360 [Nanoarchaeota archaeon]
MKKSFIIAVLALTALVLLVPFVQAHCPLCTAGVAVAAGGALWLGVNVLVIGLLVGAFAVVTGWWVANLIEKKYRRYFPGQKLLLILLSFLLTVIPLLPLMKGTIPFSLSLLGTYGSVLNRTYLFSSFLLGSLLGGSIVSVAPAFSHRITLWRSGKMLPFQGVLLTFALLLMAGLLLQFAGITIY